MPIPPSAELSPIVFREGTRLGNYMILREIGSGGMASVWLARHLSLDRLTALKILRPEFAADERNLRRFLREARSAAHLDSPVIVRIYEVGTFGKDGAESFFTESEGAVSQPTIKRSFSFRSFLPRFIRKKTSYQELHYIAEEYISGIDLGLYVRRHGPLTVSQTLRVVQQTADALQTASDAGVIHRDVKPENILLCSDGKVKVVDFGLAFFSEGTEKSAFSDLSLTRVGVTIGTPLYMSPEQAEGRDLDIRSDIYSLGASAFWMLTGRPPFAGGTPMSVLLRHINADPPNPSDLFPDIPQDVSNFVLRMMAKKKEDRFETPSILRQEAERIERELKLDSSFLNDSDKTDTSSAGRIFSESDEQAFTRELSALETTRFLQNSLTEMKIFEEESRPERFWKRWLSAAAGGLILSLLIGSGAAYLLQYRTLKNGIVPVEKLVSVEEQWVFASQLGISEGWRSVIRFYPDEKEWIDKAKHKLAVSLMTEGETEEAEKLFQEFISEEGIYRDLPFGMAGKAWISAADGDVKEGISLLSQLRKDGHVYDRQTEELISNAGELIREFGGNNSAWNLESGEERNGE